MDKTVLNDEENKTWIKIFGIYKSVGCSDEQADKLTSQDMEQEFPRLKKYAKWR